MFNFGFDYFNIQRKGSKAKPFQSVNHDIKLKRANLGDANGVISERKPI